MNYIKEYKLRQLLKKTIVKLIDSILIDNPTMSQRPILEMLKELTILYKK